MEADSRHVGVVVTRGEGVHGPLSRLLEAYGARVIHWGTIGFVPPEDPGPLLDALGRLEEYDWICFSSPRAVDAVVSRVETPPGEVRMAAVGPSTGKALQEAGWPVHRIPDEATGAGLVRSFREAGDAAGARVLFPASAIARDVVPQGLAELGAQVDQVTAYRTVNPPLDFPACEKAVNAGEVTVVTFTSPSAMEGLREGLGDSLFTRLARSVPAAAIGSTTAGALAEAGWERIQVAEESTLEGLAEAAMKAATGRA